MQIKINQARKSTSPCEFVLPHFVVLTGKNGSGKTHLLEAMADDKISEITHNNLPLRIRRYIPFNGLTPKVAESFDPKIIAQFVNATWGKIDAAIKHFAGQATAISDSQIINRLGNDELARKFIQRAQAKKKIPIANISADDLFEVFEPNDMGKADFFTAQFALIFKNYHRLFEENQLAGYYKTKQINFYREPLDNDAFILAYGKAPWDLINEIFKETSIPYEVNNPLGTRIDTAFKLELRDVTNQTPIKVSDLSTGEKVLMSLALAIYNSSGEAIKPDILLLDEPDAALHPSMTRKMIKVLKEIIVGKNGIPTIITTHSPMTIIATDGLSVYQMIRGNSVPEKVSSQFAVETLSGEIPFLRVSTEKRRQVFVESHFDVQYYESLLNIFSKLTEIHVEPIFIPARTSVGSNCTDVINIVNNLSLNGNDTVFGIVDWDTANEPKGRIIVLGHQKRYAIENFLLDPLMIGLLLIRECKVVPNEMGLNNVSSYAHVSRLHAADLQAIANYVLTELGMPLQPALEAKLFGGKSIRISEQFCLMNGHDLENLYKEKFPGLKQFHKENQLKNEIISKIINDFPQFAPVELIEAIQLIV